MRFLLSHLTLYEFSRPVFLGPHILRFRPRADGTQHLRVFNMKISPGPTGRSEGLDAENNAFSQVWFDGLTETLEIRADAEVETLRANPYDFLPSRQGQTIPMRLASERYGLLSPYLARPDGTPPCDKDSSAELARTLLEKSQRRTLDFLNLLNQYLHRNIRISIRQEQDIQSPVETLGRRKGACRDLAVLFVDVCRSVGIPARFVSGYQEGDSSQCDRDLHAWTEAFIPGGGWRGYDPTHALTVADRHVAVAAAAEPSHAAVVCGDFRGSDVTSRLHTHIDLRIST
jgi:transglutaminase-like putative cysteine protease